MASEPPTTDLGALRARLEACALELATPESALVHRQLGTDILGMLAAYDAQATRLAAVEQALTQIAEVCRMGLEGKDAIEERDAVEQIAKAAIDAPPGESP